MIIVLSWREWLADLRIERANDADLPKIQAYVDAMPSDRTAFVLDSERPIEDTIEVEFRGYGNGKLVEIYNATLAPGDQRVAKFQDRATALRRVGLRLVTLAREATVINFSEENNMPRTPNIGEFKPVRPTTNLGKVIAAYQAGTTNLADLAPAVGLSADKTVDVLRSARGSNGIDHSVAKETGEVTLVIPEGVEVFKAAPPVKEPKAPRAPKFGNFSQAQASSRLGKIIAASPATAADIAVLADCEPDDVLATLKRARVTHGIDHAVDESGSIAVFAHEMPADTVLIKPPKAPRESGNGATVRSTIPDSARIKILVEKNPHRPGVAVYGRFELYRTHQTVGEVLAAGGVRADIPWDCARKYIEIEDAP